MAKRVRYVAVGLRTDCYKLRERFCELNTMRYGAFADVWREMKFPYVFYGHNSFDELLEFTEEALRIAKEVWLKSEHLNEQACGLYTLYGLYLKQPTEGLVKIRLTSEQYDMVLKFHADVRQENHHDANFILTRLYEMSAFRFCISDHPYGLEKSYRNYHESDKSLREIKKELPYIKSLRSEDTFTELNEAFKQYHESKCQLVSPSSKTPPDLLKYVNPEFVENLQQKFNKIMQLSENKLESEGDTTVQPSSSKGKPKLNLPWWMIPVKNKLDNDLSSDSEAESDVDGDIHPVQRKTTCEERRADLNVTLGLSGDEGEDSDNDLAETETSVENEPLDMPNLF